MYKFTKMAWRNIWRNWRRTAIATIAIVLGLILLIFMDAAIEGSDQATYGNAVRLYGGNIQVHAPGFRQVRAFLHRSLKLWALIAQHLSTPHCRGMVRLVSLRKSMRWG